MINQIGSFRWVQNNSGMLTTSEKIKIMNKTLMPTVMHLFNIFFKKDTQYTHLHLRDIKIPDTPIIKDAIDELSNQANTPLINHSWRCYFWGMAFGTMNRFDFDNEALLLAALLHDIGLTDSHLHQKGCLCFTAESAHHFKLIADKHHYCPKKIHLVQDAICNHMNGYYEKDNPAEVLLLQKGAACDVIGEQIHLIPQKYRQDVMRQWGRENFNQLFKSLLKQEANNVPNSRTALLIKLGLPFLINFNSFKE